jgi:hypothetical protein
MKQALALTFLSSMTCLVAWDAEAAPHAPSAAHSHAHAAKAASHHADKTKKKVAKADRHRADKKKVAKADPRPASIDKAKARVPLSGSAKADASFTLGTGAKGPKAAHHPHAADNAKAKVEPAPSEKANEDLRAVKEPPRRSYWLAADPHVPLAVIDGTEIRSVSKQEKHCGVASRWAKPKSRWHAVNAWGQVVGSLAVSGSDLDDATGCHEVSFKGKQGAEPHVLFVSEDSDWKSSTSVAWTPKDDERRRFDHFSATLEKLWVNKKPRGLPLPLVKRAMFFQVPASAAASEKRPTRWAVVGGPILLVAYVGEHGRWKVASVQNPLGASNSYQPVGVFDMNGDKIPEIVYHSNEGPTHGDSVLSFDPDTLGWADAAVSPGGATP